MVAPALDFEAWEAEVADPVLLEWQPRSDPSPSPQDGILGIYAYRLLDRKVDIRQLVNESRVSRLTLIAPTLAGPLMERRVETPIAFGRGTATHPLRRTHRRFGMTARQLVTHQDQREKRPLSQRYRRLFGPLPFVRVRPRRKHAPK